MDSKTLTPKYSKFYKSTGITKFSKAKKILIQKSERKSIRHSTFLQNRNISSITEQPLDQNVIKPKTRLQRLIEWKEQKKQKEEEEKMKKKPIFKVSRCPSKLEEKVKIKKNKNQFQNVKSKIDTNLKKDNKILDKSYQFKMPNLPKTKKYNIPPSSIVTRSKLKRQNAIDIAVFPVQEVTLRNETFFESETGSFESFIQPAHESSRLEKSKTESLEDVKDGKYFEKLLDSEITRLQSSCNIWENYIVETDLPTNIKDDIECTICQTQLLIKSKFEQFRKLTRGVSEKSITVDDLQGFWDMMYIQIEDIDKRFDRLKNRKENSWLEKLPPIKPSTTSKTGSAVAAKPKIKATASSEIRQAMAAARKKMQELKLSQEAKMPKESDHPASPNKTQEFISNPQPERSVRKMGGIKDLLKGNPLENTKDAVVFDAGFFSVISPHTVKTPKTPSLTKRQSVLPKSLESKGRNSSPGLFMLTASRIAKVTASEIGDQKVKTSNLVEIE